MEDHKGVISYISKHKKWEEMLRVFHRLAVESSLLPVMKWSRPVYTMDGKHIIGTGAFNAHCGIWFFQGGLLKDEHKLLTNAQEGKTQAMRQMKFALGDKLDEEIIFSYIAEAISNHKKGLKVKSKSKKKTDLSIPDLLLKMLSENDELSNAYYFLTPYKQKEYAEYISDAKRDQTKEKRLAKIIPMILDGIGLNDKYRK